MAAALSTRKATRTTEPRYACIVERADDNIVRHVALTTFGVHLWEVSRPADASPPFVDFLRAGMRAELACQGYTVVD